MPLPLASMPRLFFLYFALLLSGACQAPDPTEYRSLAEEVVGPEDISTAEEFVLALVRGDSARVLALSTPSLAQPLGQNISTFADSIPDLTGELVLLNAGGRRISQLGSDEATRLTAVTFEGPLGSNWIAIQLQTANGLVDGFSYRLNPESLVATHQFRSGPNGLLPLVAAGFGILALGFSLVSAVRTARSRIKRKWLWVFLCILGIGAIRVGWTGGAVGVQLISFHLLNAGFVKAGLGAPIVLRISVPLFALIAWLKVNRSQHEPVQENGPAA